MVNFYDTGTATKINTIRLKNKMRSLKKYRMLGVN